MSGPLVSVVIPTYNRADIIDRAIESVLRQSYEQFELLVVDDSSSDETVETVEAYDDPRIRVIELGSNQGPAEARNTGIREAKGGFIAFLDSDDFWHPEKLEEQLATFEELGTDYGLVYTDAYILTDGYLKKRERREQGEIYRREIVQDRIPGTSAVMVRAGLLAQMETLFDPQLPAREDYDLWLRLTQQTKVHYVARPLAAFDRGYTNRRSADCEAHIEACEEILRRIRDRTPDLTEEEWQEIRSAHYRSLALTLAAYGEYRHAAQAVCEGISSFSTAIKSSPVLSLTLVPPAHKAARRLHQLIQKLRFRGAPAQGRDDAPVPVFRTVGNQPSVDDRGL